MESYCAECDEILDVWEEMLELIDKNVLKYSENHEQKRTCVLNRLRTQQM